MNKTKRMKKAGRGEEGSKSFRRIKCSKDKLKIWRRTVPKHQDLHVATCDRVDGGGSVTPCPLHHS